MTDFKKILKVCRQDSLFTRDVIDNKLISYAASHDNLEREVIKRLSPYRHITNKVGKNWTEMIMSQYIAHRIFRQGGFIRKYINHSEMKSLTSEEFHFIHRQIKVPWSFSFSFILNRPEKYFFKMQDVLLGQSYLLYSPGLEDILSKEQALMFFNLICFNGECWQTYGPISYYKGFEPYDIAFFASELDPSIDIENGLSISENIDNNPVPYMMLFSGGNYPLNMYEDEQLVQVLAEYDVDFIDTKKLREDFIVEYNKDVYKLGLKQWGEHPHFASAYFDENEKILLLYAFTERGFKELTKVLIKHGFNVEQKPFLKVNMSMLVTANSITKKEIVLNEYENLFTVKTSPEKQKELDKINAFMSMVTDELNQGKQPDVETLANKADIDVAAAKDLFAQIMSKFDNLKK